VAKCEELLVRIVTTGLAKGIDTSRSNYGQNKFRQCLIARFGKAIVKNDYYKNNRKCA
jgi:hypothetical protein